MAGPVANNSLKISIDGVDNASQAVDKAKKSLQGLAAETKKTGQATQALASAGGGTGGIDAAKIQSTTQRAGGALSALAGAMGPTGEAIAGVGREASGLGAVAGVLPGPIGLAAAAIVGAGAAGYFLAKAANEAQAKLRLLVSVEGGALAKTLDLGTDAAVKLSSAMADLGDKGIRPTDAILQQVAKNAKDLGLDPADSVAKFIAAWKDGPEAVAKVGREIGKVSVVLQSVPQVARGLGLDPKALGLEASVSTADRLKSGLEETAKIKANLTAATTAEAALYAASAKATSDQQQSLQAQAAAQGDIAAGLRTQLADQATDAKFRAKKIEAEKSFGDVTKAVAAIQAGADAEASLAASKIAGTDIRIEGIKRAQAALSTEIATQQKLIDAGTGKEAIDRKASLQASSALLDVQRKTILDAEKAEAKAKAKEGADKARSARAAKSEADLGLLKAQIDSDGIQSAAERIKVVEAERAKELLAVKDGGAAKKTKAVQVAKIEQETANKIRAIAVDETAAAAKDADDRAKKLGDAADLSIDIARKADDARAALAKGTAADTAARLRELGDEDGAILAERAQAQADYAAAVKASNDELMASNVNANNAAQDFANLEAARLAKQADAKRVLAAFDDKAAQAASARFRDGIAMAADAVKGPAQMLAAIGGSGSNLGKGLGAAADGVGKVAKGWKGLKSSAPDAIAASGEVAAAFIDDERTKAGILAISEGAAALASFANPAAAAAHGAAALLYAGIAGGVIGSAGSGAGGASSGSSPGGLTSSAPTGGVSTAAPVGGGNVTINFNQPLVTKQEVGKVVHGALRSIGQTGMAKAQGV